LADRQQSVSVLKASYPSFFMSKNKVTLKVGMDVDGILEKIKNVYIDQNPSTIDGVKIDFDDRWIHLRKSNTEPIIRIYTEAPSQAVADGLAETVLNQINALI